MQKKIVNGILYFFLAAACLAACGLFSNLPFRALNTELVYKGF